MLLQLEPDPTLCDIHLNKMRLTFLTFVLFLSFPATSQAQDVLITGLQDYNFGSFSGDEDMDDTLCIYKSSGNKRYWVTATGSGTGGAFELQDGGNSFAYGVRWQKAGGNFGKLTAGVAKRYGGADKVNTDCGGVDNAGLRIEMRESNVAGAPAGSYGGSLTLLIEPD